jgi:S1-C subfamily serine protease
MAVGDLRAGENATFTVIRDRQQMEIRVRIEARTEQAAADNRRLWPGVTVVPLNDQLRQRLELEDNARGLLAAQIISGSPADIVGLRQNDRIISINGHPVNDIAEFYRVLRERTSTELWFGIIRTDSTLETLRFRR